MENELLQLIKSASKDNPLRVSYEKSTSYYKDFMSVIACLKNEISKQEYSDIIQNKLFLGKKRTNLSQYYEFATELCILYKFLCIPHVCFKYEQPVTNLSKKNPECTVYSDEFVINVEAKCPVLTDINFNDATKTNKIAFTSAGRLPEFEKEYQMLKTSIEESNPNSEMQIVKNKDNTMKDFLQSAHGKFADFRNDKEINVLCVSLDDIKNIQDWFNYLYQNDGLLTIKPFVSHDTFSRVDVIIFSNLLFRHKNNERIYGNAWSIDESFVLFMSNQFRQGCKKEAHYYLKRFFNNSYTNELASYVVEGDYQGYQWATDAIKVIVFEKKELEENRNIFLFEQKV